MACRLLSGGARRILARPCGSHAPRTRSRSRPPTGAQTYARARRRRDARGRARAAGARRAAPAIASRSRCPPRAPFVEALHGCLRLGAVAVPIDLRLSEAERTARIERCAVVVDAPLYRASDRAGAAARRVPAAAGSSGPHTHDLDATAIVVHTSGTTVRRPARRADLRQLAVERARLGRRARPRPRRALAVHAAAVARRRAVDPPAQRDLRDDGRRARRLRRAPCRGRAASRRGDARLGRADDARPPARRRPARPARGCAPRSSAAGRSRRRCSSVRAPRACAR